MINKSGSDIDKEKNKKKIIQDKEKNV